MADRDSVRRHMARALKQPLEKLRDEAALTDLVAESLVLVDMVIELQEEFRLRLSQPDLKDVKTVGQLLRLFEGPRA